MRIELSEQEKRILVPVERVHDMGVYVITDGNMFVKQNVNGSYTSTTNLTLAETYKSKKLAQSILNNALTYSMRNTYYVAEFVNNKLVQCGVPLCKKIENRKNIQTFRYENTFEDMEWCKKFINLDGVFKDAIDRGYELSEEIGDIDAKIVDLEHYIEFNPLNARDGYKIYRKLRELLCKRRHLKNEQKVVSAINENHSAEKQLSNIIAVINDCKNREYKPRKLVGLFEKGIPAIEKEA